MIDRVLTTYAQHIYYLFLFPPTFLPIFPGIVSPCLVTRQGLMGIEIYDSRGHPVKFTNPEQQISANPADINVLPEYGSDTRTIDNLLDGINYTCNDINHAWLAPFTAGQPHFIFIDFEFEITLGMIRIWNYNKSRIHSERGVRYLEIALDGAFIFKGEIKKAPGSVSGAPSECCESLMFSSSPELAASIARHDPIIIAR